jgi:superfamily II DNA/RNA helicase
MLASHTGSGKTLAYMLPLVIGTLLSTDSPYQMHYHVANTCRELEMTFTLDAGLPQPGTFW